MVDFTLKVWVVWEIRRFLLLFVPHVNLKCMNKTNWLRMILLLGLVNLWVLALQPCHAEVYETYCANLSVGQFFCSDPEIDALTQQPKGCTRNNTAPIWCTAAEGITCLETKNNTFLKDAPCLWTNGYSFETSLLLSIFLGMFGADRFYLGYPAHGLLKLCTLGCMFLGQIIDIILIATQTVKPADGSNYIINYFGPRLTPMQLDNDTYRIPQPDWHEL